MQSNTNLYAIFILLIGLLFLYTGALPENFNTIMVLILILIIGYIVMNLISNNITNNINGKESFESNQNKQNIVNIYDNNNEFDPKIIVIKPRDTVTWINKGNRIHRVKGISFDSKDIQPNQTFSMKFDNKNTYYYNSSQNDKNPNAVIVQ